MNIYEKMQEAKAQLLEKNISKSGVNKFSNYNYFELGDFTPPLIEILKKLKLFTAVSFSENEATLTIINAEKPDEKVTFTSPMREATLKGAHPIQNLGAVETYQRRYLYMMAFDIVDSDVLDSIQGKPQTNAQPKQYFCYDCGKPFAPFTAQNGQKYTTEQVYRIACGMATDNIGRCSNCLTKSGKKKSKEENK